MLLGLVLSLLVCSTLAQTNHTTDKIWPKPANFSYNVSGENITVSPCDIKYVIEAPSQLTISEIISLYQIQVFGCGKTTEGKVILNVIVKNTDQFIATDLKHEKYSLIIRNNSRWELSADYYVGFLRAF